MAKIIVTDDASISRDMLGELVEKLGHTVIATSSGEELLEVYQKEHPDIVFLDIIMEENGLDVLDKLMAVDAAAKVVICSSMGGMPHIVSNAEAKGAVTCIRKPLKIEEISAAIEMCLSSD